jgi:hypothetical protein
MAYYKPIYFDSDILSNSSGPLVSRPCFTLGAQVLQKNKFDTVLYFVSVGCSLSSWILHIFKYFANKH